MSYILLSYYLFTSLGVTIINLLLYVGCKALVLVKNVKIVKASFLFIYTLSHSAVKKAIGQLICFNKIGAVIQLT